MLVLYDALSQIFIIANSSNLTHLILTNLIDVIAPQNWLLSYLAFQCVIFDENLMKGIPKTRCAHLI
jgi:hypothetical protein